MATFNMARYLPLAVNSVLQQTYKNIEVIVVDNGSTDDTADAIRPFLTDKRLRFLRLPSKGRAVARNRGIQEAQGELVAFLDADDKWCLNKLELQVPLFFKSKATGVVCSRFIYVDELGTAVAESNHELFKGRVTGRLFIFNFVGFGTAVARRECFDRLGGFNEDIVMGDDYDLWLRLSTEYDFDYIDSPLLYYRVWPGQISKNFRGRYVSGIETMKRFLRQFPGHIARATEREAWAHTYVGFGHCILEIDRQMSEALGLYVQALYYKPTYIPAWRAMAEALWKFDIRWRPE
jgi:glycosyltransferase involved in cell wall biosynthesis